MEKLNSGENYDAVWVSNSIWLYMLDDNVKVSNSKYTSINPIVFGIKKSKAKELGFTDKTIKTKDIVNAISSGKLKFSMSNPTSTNSGASAYLGFLYTLAGNPEVLKKENLQMAKEENIKIEEKNDNIEEEPQVEKIEEVKTGIETEVLENNVPTKFTDEYNGVKIKNETDNKLTKEILTPNVTVNMKNILIFHTHTCESYTPSEKYSYKQTGNFRTTDRNYSVVRAGRELENYLVPYGYNVIHDESYHDYPSYSGSYSSSLETVEKILKKNENYDIVLDLHRDAIGDNTYAPTVKIGDEYAAQLMFVIGSNGGVDEHKNWQENLKFAVKVQEKANELYPGLFKPIILRNSDYNQFVSKAASIIEVGATGNTLEQCLVSMKYLSKVIRELK